MELCRLSTTEERRKFAKNLLETRLSKGAGFSETQRSHIGEVHLAFGQLYGLFDEQANPGEMLAGFAMHDLGSFPQSYPKPDLTHLPPEAVVEVGELWARAAGSARLARQAAQILVGQMGVEAVLAYPILKPWNLSMAYKGDFDCVGEPIEWPYIRTLGGERMFVQAMVSQGEKLGQMVREAGQWGFQANEDHSRIIFMSPHRVFIRPARPIRTPVTAQDAAA